MFKGTHITCAIKMFVADTPAKAYVLNVEYHSDYSSYTKCITEGEFIYNRICFPEVDFVLRTDISFIERDDDAYHQGISPLINLPNLGLVTNVPLDYLHLYVWELLKK